MKIQGWDLSLNHCGMVEMDENGTTTWFHYVIDKATQVKGHWGTRLQLEKSDDRQKHHIRRLMWWQKFFTDVLNMRKPDYVVIEDYALSAQSNATYQIGELGGAARMAVLNYGAKLRLHDPVSVKMYIAHNGAAKPEEVAGAVMDRWPKTAVWRGLNKDPMLDLIVGYALARMGLDEVMLRSGKLLMSSLHAKEVQVFNRCTKANPTSLLSREFI